MKNYISPFHLLLAGIIAWPILAIRFAVNPFETILAILIFLGYSFYYYKNLKKEQNLTFWESIKNDMPTGLNSTNIILFLLIMSPFIFVLVSILFAQ